MAWRDQLQSPSFRGVPFLTKGDLELRFGRRTVTHILPVQDVPVVEDLGLLPRRFKLSMFVVGATYMTERDALIGAVETSGPATLIHPTYGKVTVSVEGEAVCHETTDLGGCAEVQITCVTSSLTDDLGLAVDTAAAVHTLTGVDAMAGGLPAIGVLGALAAVFSAAFNVANLPFAIGASLLSQAAGLFGFFTQNVWGVALAPLGSYTQIVSLIEATAAQQGLALGAIESTADVVTGLSQATAVTAIALGAVQDAQTDGTTTAATTTTTTGATTSAPAPLPPTPTTPATGPDGGPLPNNGTLPEAVAAIAKLAVGGTIPVAVTPTGPIAALLTPGGAALAQQQAAAAALLQMTQILLIVAACDAAARVDYPSAQSALAMRQTLGDVLDEIVLGVEDEDLYASLMNLEAAVWQHLTVTASGLPSVATYTPPRMLPMLAIAQQVYGDARMEGQILVENDVANPARVPGGVALEVLSDAA